LIKENNDTKANYMEFDTKFNQWIICYK
jgi:hypothetical protein